MKPSFLKKALFFYLPPLFWAAAIFVFSSFPGEGSQYGNFWMTLERKGAHVVEYFVLAFLLARAFFESGRFSMKWSGYLTLTFSMAYAISDEIHQLFVSGRSGKISDVLIDLLGISLGIFVYLKFFSKHQQGLPAGNK